MKQFARNGRLLMEKGQLDIGGVLQKIDCEVGFYDLSAHAGHKELVEFIHGSRPEKVVLMHSDDREALAEALGDRYEVLMPRTGKGIEV